MIWLQVITAFFAIACAWLNKWPVLIMRGYWQEGSHQKKEREFHAANAVVKVLWALFPFPAIWIYQSHLRAASILLLLLLIQWLVFDIALNLFTGKPWYYLGQTAKLDRLVRNGKIKAIILLLIIILLNYLIQ